MSLILFSLSWILVIHSYSVFFHQNKESPPFNTSDPIYAIKSFLEHISVCSRFSVRRFNLLKCQTFRLPLVFFCFPFESSWFLTNNLKWSPLPSTFQFSRCIFVCCSKCDILGFSFSYKYSHSLIIFHQYSFCKLLLSFSLFTIFFLMKGRILLLCYRFSFLPWPYYRLSIFFFHDSYLFLVSVLVVNFVINF